MSSVDETTDSDEELYIEFLERMKNSLTCSYVCYKDMKSLSEERSQGYLCSQIIPNTNLCGLHAVNNLLKKSNTLDKTMPYFTIEDMNQAIDVVTNAFAKELKPDAEDDSILIPTSFPSFQKGMSRREKFEGYINHVVGVKDIGPVSPRVLNTMLSKRGLVMRNISQPLARMDPEKFDAAVNMNESELKDHQVFEFTSLYHRKELRRFLANEDFDMLRRARMNLLLLCWKYDKTTSNHSTEGHFICVTSDGKMFDNTIDFKASGAAQKLENKQCDEFSLDNVLHLGVGHCNPTEEMWFCAYEVVSQENLNKRIKTYGHQFAEGLLHVAKNVPGCSTKKRSLVMSIFDQNKYWMSNVFTRHSYEEYRNLSKYLPISKKQRRATDDDLEQQLFPYFGLNLDDLVL